VRQANLSGVHLGGADLNRADLTEANLRAAQLTRADLTDSSLTRADLGVTAQDPLTFAAESRTPPTRYRAKCRMAGP
jgi:uncharacterized protein YjbI with pentapeptide repeats